MSDLIDYDKIVFDLYPINLTHLRTLVRLKPGPNEISKEDYALYETMGGVRWKDLTPKLRLQVEEIFSKAKQ